MAGYATIKNVRSYTTPTAEGRTTGHDANDHAQLQTHLCSVAPFLFLYWSDEEVADEIGQAYQRQVGGDRLKTCGGFVSHI